MTLIDQVYLGVFAVMVFSSVMWLSLYTANRKIINNDPEPSRFPGVTFLVPAYNEEENIAETIKALLNQDYPEDKLKIIAINDGSTDNTLEILQRFKDKITIIDKENSGKASSMNQALEKVETEIVGCMDGDSFPDPGMTCSMIGYMEKESVKGVSPAIKVHDPETWPQKIIWAEYVYQVFLRKVFSLFNAQYVLPGPGSIYETEFLKESGGWDQETLTEDMEIAFRIIEQKKLLENSTNAYVYTISPPTITGLFRQRIRWYKGYMNNFWKYKHIVFNREYGNIGVFFLPFTVLWIFLLMFLITHMSYRILDRVWELYHSLALTGFMIPSPHITIQSLTYFHLFYGLFVVVGIGTLLISLKVSGEKIELRKRKIHYLLFLWIYAMLFAGFWVAAALSKLKGGKKW